VQHDSSSFLALTTNTWHSTLFTTLNLFKNLRLRTAIVCVCPSVRLSHIVSERHDESGWFFGVEASFNVSYTLGCKKIRASPKIRVASLGNFVPNSGLRESFATTRRSCCERNSSTVELVDHTYDRRDASWLFATRRSTVTPSYFDMLWICCTTCSYSR